MVESHILLIPMEFMGFFMRALTRQYRDQWNNIIRFWKKTDPEEISQIFIIFDENKDLTIFHPHDDTEWSGKFSPKFLDHWKNRWNCILHILNIMGRSIR